MQAIEERRMIIMSEEDKALARHSWGIVDNPDLIDEVYAPDVVWHEPDQDIQGHEGARQFVTMYKTAAPDLRATVEDVIAEEDKVVTRWTVRGTHQGEIEEFGPQLGGRQRSWASPCTASMGQDSRGVGGLR
jgi:predicted ester cyclase